MAELHYAERRAAGEAEGLLILHHGRGTDELDLLGLADVLDPDRRLHVVSPRGPLTFAGSPGHHWYVVPRVGYPDPATFAAAYEALAAFHDAIWAATGLTPGRTVLGGFSMGCVMSYALGLGPDRPAPAGILGFSGFIPTVEGWQPDVAARVTAGTKVNISHGVQDPVISVEFARAARQVLESEGLNPDYLETPAGHQIHPLAARAAISWLPGVV
jgi:phospholipase/carboxylesterase